MASLVACIGSGKGTWGHVGRLISDGVWDKILIITNEFSKDKFKVQKEIEMLVLENKGIIEMVEDARRFLDGKLSGDVAVNFVSGDGKEHMATLSALLKLGVGIRLVALTRNGISEI